MSGRRQSGLPGMHEMGLHCLGVPRHHLVQGLPTIIGDNQIPLDQTQFAIIDRGAFAATKALQGSARLHVPCSIVWGTQVGDPRTLPQSWPPLPRSRVNPMISAGAHH